MKGWTWQKWHRSALVGLCVLTSGCLPWRSQKDPEAGHQNEFKDWEEFVELEVDASYSNLETSILRNGLDFDAYKSPGPIPYQVFENRLAFWRDGTTVTFDNVIPRSASPTPLVILVHGNHSHKEAHRYQAERLASYGIHTIVLQVVNQGQWLTNGHIIQKFVQRVRKYPRKFGGLIHKQKIILAGHSFGGSAVSVATGLGAKVKGLILLDPALVSDAVSYHLKSIKQPLLLIGADQSIFRARRQGEFSKHTLGEFTKVAIKGATHDDAQFPSMYSHSAFGYDPYTQHDKQQIFAALLTLGALSLSATNSLLFATDTITHKIAKGEVVLVEQRAKAASITEAQVVQQR